MRRRMRFSPLSGGQSEESRKVREEGRGWWERGNGRRAREYLAGLGGLSVAWESVGFEALCPFETEQSGESSRVDQDLARRRVVEEECKAGESGDAGFAHLSIPGGPLGALEVQC